MTQLSEEGEDVKLDRKAGIFRRGVWGDASGLELSRVVPGEPCTLTIEWKLKRQGADPPQDVVFHVYPEVAKRSDLPDPLFKLGGAIVEGSEEGLVRVEWTPPKDPAEWPDKLPARLLFMPVLENWRLRKGKRPWKQPLVDLEDAWEVKSCWEPPSEYVGGQAKLTTLVYGLDPAQTSKVKFTLFYVVGVAEAPLSGLEGVSGEVEAELTSEGVENKGEALASVIWQIPNPDLLREAAEKAGLDPDEEDEDDGIDAPLEVSAATALLPRTHTIRFKMEVGDADDQLQGFGDLDVREPRFFFSL
ncbi:MAG: hypothetical protein JKY65_11720 [Planctomycetes bacterium]|nr:hypothetical protein [Planctomycetota bacterium]